MLEGTLNDPTTVTNRDGRHDYDLVNTFLENVPDSVYFKDREGRFLAVSRSKLTRNNLTDYSQIIGKTDFDFFSESAAAAARRDEEQIMRTGCPIIGKLEYIRWTDGRDTWAIMCKMPLRDETGRIIGTFGITKDVTESKRVELELERTRKELLDASRLAGMAEVATGVLHNVGNVLTSINVSASVIATTLRQSKIDSLARVVGLLQEHSADIADYVNNDPKGRLIPGLIASLAKHMIEERDRLIREILSLQQGVDHIRDIVVMQQAYATMSGLVETLEPAAMVEDSLRMNTGALVRHEVRVVRDFQRVMPVVAERGKVLQILVNLIRNAKYACDEGGAADKVVTLRVCEGAPGKVRVIVQDNGIGISAENLRKIFTHGFTTRANGHGFGLHSSVLAAREMNGSLTVHSDGPGKGAVFTLELPIAKPVQSDQSVGT